MVVVPVVGVCLWADDYEVGDAKGPKCRILPRVFITMQCHPPPTFPLAAPISAGRTDGASYCLLVVEFGGCEFASREGRGRGSKGQG